MTPRNARKLQQTYLIWWSIECVAEIKLNFFAICRSVNVALQIVKYMVATNQMLVQRAILPQHSLAEKSLPRFDYKDAYACKFYADKELTVEDTVLAFFNSSPSIVSSLFWLRNKIVKPFGLKTSDNLGRQKRQNDFKVEIGNALGLFCVIDKSAREVLIGEDDKHLNFRISFLLERRDQSSNEYLFTLSTTVFIKNSFGYLYFFPVKPFHKAIVPGMVKRIAKQLSAK